MSRVGEADFADWVGRIHTGSDMLTLGLLQRFAATVPAFSGNRDDPPATPYCLHWCLAPVIEPTANLGPDGHPRLGLQLPPIPLARRMWAGGELTFHGPLQAGDVVTRRSMIASIEAKQGRSGGLTFVRVQHEHSTERGTAVSEAQDIVYREPTGRVASAAASPEPDFEVARCESVDTDPVLLFRYSALTFNGHRIHYDHPYATETEGYPGLVVHGPLIATLLANLAAGELGTLSVFRFKSRAPLFLGETLKLLCSHGERGAKLEARNGAGGLIMTASAE